MHLEGGGGGVGLLRRCFVLETVAMGVGSRGGTVVWSQMGVWDLDVELDDVSVRFVVQRNCYAPSDIRSAAEE